VRRDHSWYLASFEHFKETRASLFPPNIPASLAASEDFSRQPETASYRLFGKYNHALSRSKDLRLEASFTRLENLNELSSATSLPSASTNNLAKTFLGTAAFTTIFSPRSFLESSVGYRDQRFSQNEEGTDDGASYSISFLDGGSGFSFGPPLGSVQSLDQKYLTIREVFTLFSGARHAAKLGAEYVRTAVDGVNGQGFQNVIVTTHPFFDLYGRESFQIPQGVGFFNPGDEQTRLRNDGISLFVQDDWRIAKKLTLNLGVRYDYDSKFQDADNVAPRIGITWNPDSKTVVRANWGLFYDRYRLGIAQAVPSLGGFNGRTVVELDYPRLTTDALVPLARSLGAIAAFLRDPLFINRAFDIPAGAVVTRSNIQSLTGMTPDQFLTELRSFLTGLGRPFNPVDFSPGTGYLRQDLSAGFQDVIRTEDPFRTPHNETFLVGVQRALWPDLAMSLTYVHRDIRDVLGLRLTNLAFESRSVGARSPRTAGRSRGPRFLLRRQVRRLHRGHRQALPEPLPSPGQLHLLQGHRQPAELQPRDGNRHPGGRGGSHGQPRPRVRSRELRPVRPAHLRAVGGGVAARGFLVQRRHARHERRPLHRGRYDRRLRRRRDRLAPSARNREKRVHGALGLQPRLARREALPLRQADGRLHPCGGLQRHQRPEPAADRHRLRRWPARPQLRPSPRPPPRPGDTTGTPLALLGRPGNGRPGPALT